jgi:hypothetical protein
MDLPTIVANLVLSLFIALNVYCLYLYIKRRIPLDPESAMNHAILRRFKSARELERFHEAHAKNVLIRANKALGTYACHFRAALGGLDPRVAERLRAPKATFGSVDDIEKTMGAATFSQPRERARKMWGFR